MSLIGVLCALSTVQTAPASRITQPVNDGLRVTLKGNIYPLAQARFDLGAVADSFPASRMLLLLQRSSEREAALGQFFEEAHRPGSASFHKWLKPEQFGQLYGPTDSEVAVVSGWLQQHGFSINRVNQSKTAIEFSGTASEVRSAFHTQIHAYLINGEEHYANDVDPQIPAALASVIAGITPINNFRPRSDLKKVGKGLYDPRTHQFTRGVNAPAGKLDGLATGSVTFTDPVGSSTVNSGPVNINRLGSRNGSLRPRFRLGITRSLRLIREIEVSTHRRATQHSRSRSVRRRR